MAARAGCIQIGLFELVHGREERLEFRIVERLAGDVGVDLHAERAVLDRAFALAHAGVRRAERALRHPAGEVVGMFLRRSRQSRH